MDTTPKKSLIKSPKITKEIVQFLRNSMTELESGNADFSFSDVKRAFGTLLMQGDDTYDDLISKGVKAINTKEGGVRGVANFAPRNESHHGTGLKIVSNPVLPAVRQQGAGWLTDFLGRLDESGYQGYGSSGEGFTSLERGQHIDIGHRTDPFSAFMGRVMDPNVTPEQAVKDLQGNIDEQIAASVEAQENKWTARQRLLVGQWTGIDPVAKPNSAKAGVAKQQRDLGINLNEEVTRQVGDKGRTQLILPRSLRQQLQTPSGRRSFVRSGQPYQLFSNPSAGAVSTAPLDALGRGIKNNAKGEALGAGYGLFLDPRNQQAIEKGDAGAVVRNTAQDTAIGAGVQALTSKLATAVPQLAPAFSQLSAAGPIALLNTALDPGANGGLTEVQKNNVRALQSGQPAAVAHAQRAPQAYGRQGPTAPAPPPPPKPQPKPTPKPRPKPTYQQNRDKQRRLRRNK